MAACAVWALRPGVHRHRRHGRSGRYTYYTCFTRHRYGTKHCANDRLPADALEQAIADRLKQALADQQLLDDALTRAYQRLTELQPQRDAELAATEQKLTETRVALERYFHAFERGTMPEETCAPRIAELGQQVQALERRHGELAEAAHDLQTPEQIHADDLAHLRRQLDHALNHGAHARCNAILQTLIHEIASTLRAAIQPVFRAPRFDH